MYDELIKRLRELASIPEHCENVADCGKCTKEENGGKMMSVLIKGMEMPTRCGECLLAKLSPTGESLICNYMLSRVPWDERPFDCLLAPVPPHGRLIDADALIKELTLDDEDDNSGASLLMAIFLEVLKAAPTIIEAEEGE